MLETILLFLLITTLGIGAILGVYLFVNREELRRKKRLYEAQAPAWHIQQVEHEADQRIRAATHSAMTHMMHQHHKRDGGVGDRS